jgi:RNA polymerase sigma-70 factor (ECF subfamily)
VSLLEEHNRALHAFLMTRVRDEHEARDVAQEAYARVLQLHRPGAINFLRAYLFKTAANIAINRAKQRTIRGRLDQLDAHHEVVDPLTPERRVLAAEEIEVLRRALFELPPKCRRAFVLHRFQEWDVERIASRLGVGPRMVRHYLMQAGLYCQLRIRGLSPAAAKAETQR